LAVAEIVKTRRQVWPGGPFVEITVAAGGVLGCGFGGLLGYGDK
jgi:hypothetical protein